MLTITFWQQYDVEIQHSVLKELLGPALINGSSSAGAALLPVCLPAQLAEILLIRWLYKGPAERLSPFQFIQGVWMNLSYLFLDSAMFLEVSVVNKSV